MIIFYTSLQAGPATLFPPCLFYLIRVNQLKRLSLKHQLGLFKITD